MTTAHGYISRIYNNRYAADRPNNDSLFLFHCVVDLVICGAYRCLAGQCTLFFLELKFTFCLIASTPTPGLEPIRTEKLLDLALTNSNLFRLPVCGDQSLLYTAHDFVLTLFRAFHFPFYAFKTYKAKLTHSSVRWMSWTAASVRHHSPITMCDVVDRNSSVWQVIYYCPFSVEHAARLVSK